MGGSRHLAYCLGMPSSLFPDREDFLGRCNLPVRTICGLYLSAQAAEENPLPIYCGNDAPTAITFAHGRYRPCRIIGRAALTVGREGRYCIVCSGAEIPQNDAHGRTSIFQLVNSLG